MDMQDKEMDDLFRTKLEDFETEPSARVWENIDEELNTGDRKKRFWLPVLSAAASIIVLVTAGMLFIGHKTNNNTHKPGKQLAVQAVKPVRTDTVNRAVAVVHIPQQRIVNKLMKQLPVHQIAKNSTVQPQQKPDSVIAKQPVTQPKQQKMMAALPEMHGSFAQSNKIDSVAPMATTIAVKPVDKPVAIAANTSPEEKPVAKHRRSRHILSLGDMVNTVVAAVDKRKDKLIEFSDTDDDESTITGVNLGIIAVKKQN